MESFWMIPLRAMRTPIGVLREQCVHLGKLTSGVLVGDVRIASAEHGLTLHLEIVAPALSEYRYRVLSYFQTPTVMYPGYFKFGAGTEHRVENEAEFTAALRRRLRCETVTTNVAALLAQVSDL